MPDCCSGDGGGTRYWQCQLTFSHFLVEYYRTLLTVVADYYNLLSDFFYAEERTLWFLDPEEVAVYGEDDGDEYVLKTEMKAHMEKYLWNQVDGAAWTFFAKVSRYFGLQPNLTSFVCHPTNATSLPTGNQTSIGATQTAR